MSLNLNETDFIKTYPFLSVLDRPLDDRQLKVCCTDGDDPKTDNIVVAAGAGSGKTQVLAARFAFLVVTGAADADQILTLTFTKKAAAEMYQRIYATLQKIASSPDAKLTAVQQERVEKALKDFSNAHIQTLDSYCSYLVRQAANRYGIRPDFSGGENDSRISASALEYVLKNQKSPGIANLAQAGKIQDLAENVFAPVIKEYTSVISPEDFFSSKLPLQCDLAAQGWNEWAQAFQDLVDLAKEADLIFQPLVAAVRAKKKEDDGKKSTLEKIADSAQILASFSLPLPKLEGQDILEHRKDSEIDQAYFGINELHQRIAEASSGAKTVKEIKNDVTLTEFWERLKEWRKEEGLPSIYSFINHLEDIKDLLGHFDAFLAESNRQKKKSGQLTFTDVSEVALSILKNHQDIRQQEHETYRRIMIDEFQDNNRKNGELLALLERPTFFVGDDKQSIYKFRGAEVDVFNGKQEDMTRGFGALLPMDYNYRSNPQLLKAFNQIFGGYQVIDHSALKRSEASKAEKFRKIELEELSDGDSSQPWVFPESFTLNDKGQPVDIYKARFTIDSTAEKNPLVPLRPKDTFEYNNPLNAVVPVHSVMYNTVCLPDDNSEDYMGKDQRLAFYLAQTILDLKAKTESEIDPDTGKNKIFSYSDVAVLDRSRTHRGELTSVLSRFGIPYSVDQQSNLFSEGIINDFYHFLRLCAYSFDVNAFASFLRSPFAALSQRSLETVLFVAVKDKPSEDQDPPAFQAFAGEDREAILGALSKGEGEKYLKAEKLYEKIRTLALRENLTRVITCLWYDLGYCYNAYWHKDTSVFASQYDLLFELARQSDQDGHTLTWFVDQLAQQRGSSFAFSKSEDSELGIKEVSFPLEEAEGVKIMTIHKSKGLQFKYVFILGCTGKPKGESNREQYFFTEEEGLSVKFNDDKSNFFFQRQKEVADAKADAEFRRLFYVALTRAEQQAWILGSWNRPLGSKSKAVPSMVETIIDYYYSPEEKDLSELESKEIIQTVYPYNEEKSAPFDYIELYPLAKTRLYQMKSEEAPSKAGMEERSERVERNLDQARLIAYPQVKSKRTSPSKLESSDREEKEGASSAPYQEVNAIIEKTWKAETKSYEFGYNDFGTLAHYFMEMNALGKKAEEIKIPDDMAKKLYGTNRETIFASCKKMIQAFNESPRGQDFAASRQRGDFFKSEYSFRMKVAGLFITGSIDLVYQSQKGLVIVDYKTDQEENPQRYYEQLYCYRRAAASLCRVKEEEISCHLFYLRYGKEVDITGQVSKITEGDIEKKLEEMLDGAL